MNASDVLKYGDGWFLRQVEGMPEDQWETLGATGSWSCKDVLSHVTSYEVFLVDLLREFKDNGNSDKDPIGDHKQFNVDETEKRRERGFQEVLDEYKEAHLQVMELISQIDPEKCREVGTLAWYGEEYSLDDYLVYTFYGHKREHGAQIAGFKDRLESKK